MSTNIEYQFHHLTGSIDNPRPGLSADGDAGKKGGAALRMRMEKGDTASYFGALKHMVKSSGGPAILVSLGVIGIPFLIYFVALGAATVLRTFG